MSLVILCESFIQIGYFFYELCKKTKVGVIFCIIVPCDAGAIYITTKGYIPSSHVTVPCTEHNRTHDAAKMCDLASHL